MQSSNTQVQKQSSNLKVQIYTLYKFKRKFQMQSPNIKVQKQSSNLKFKYTQVTRKFQMQSPNIKVQRQNSNLKFKYIHYKGSNANFKGKVQI